MPSALPRLGLALRLPLPLPPLTFKEIQHWLSVAEKEKRELASSMSDAGVRAESILEELMLIDSFGCACSPFTLCLLLNFPVGLL